MTPLTDKRCTPCSGETQPLDLAAAASMLKQLQDHWKLAEQGQAITASFKFRNYFRTLTFVNAVAYIAVREDHHPDVSFGYDSCTIRYSTHAIQGLSENDFICAAKVDALLADA